MWEEADSHIVAILANHETTLMPVIFPSPELNDAHFIIRKMRILKSRRFNHDISRARFLRDYQTLREALNRTPEYHQLRKVVYARSKGVCEKCKVAVGEHLCHKIAVAFRPDLALRVDNVYFGCVACHQLDHPDLEIVR